jgi:polyisoprenoid-binding protein YceI
VIDEDGVPILEAGTYVLDLEQSTFTWSGKKPLIDGYVNTGSIAFSEGAMELTEDRAMSGAFTLDMNTLSVSETPTKPGEESLLEKHLMSATWFDTTAFPTAIITIASVVPRADVAETNLYDVKSSLTMHGETHELRFMATIETEINEQLRATAKINLNRTTWGITAGSDSILDNLGDNVIDDIIPITFDLLLKKQ